MVVTLESFAQEDNLHDLTHWHDALEVIRVVEHSMSCVVNGIEYVLHKDDICIINHGQLHRICCISGKNCTFQRLMIDPSLFTADRTVYQKYLAPMLTDETFAHVRLKSGNRIAAEIVKVIEEIADVERHGAVAFELQVLSLLFLFFQRLYQYYCALKGQPASPVNPDVLLYRRIADFIYQNYGEKLTLDAIAASGNVSRSKCCAVFKEYAGHSPIAFLNLYRLQVSTGLLKDTAEPIASIAAACGFGQQSYYNRLFLREYGVTPKEYRAAS